MPDEISRFSTARYHEANLLIRFPAKALKLLQPHSHVSRQVLEPLLSISLIVDGQDHSSSHHKSHFLPWKFFFSLAVGIMTARHYFRLVFPSCGTTSLKSLLIATFIKQKPRFHIYLVSVCTSRQYYKNYGVVFTPLYRSKEGSVESIHRYLISSVRWRK